MALAAGLLAGCTTLTPVASIKATVNAPGFPEAPAKVHVESRSFPQLALSETLAKLSPSGVHVGQRAYNS